MKSSTSLKKALAVRRRLARQGKRVVFTNGCFDLIHAGHVRYLAAAGKMGDFLIIGLNSDSSVRRLKKAGRPLMPFSDRAEVLAGLKSVDMVVGFSEDTPLKLIKSLKPDILIKGADYKIKDIVGGEFVKSYGGSVKTVPLAKGRSTSSIIRKLRSL